MKNQTAAIRYCLAVLIASIIISLMGCALIEPYEPEYNQLDAISLNRAYKDYRQAYRQGCTDDTFIEWLNNDSGNGVYEYLGGYEENDSIVGSDTLYYWIKLD